MDWGSLFLSTRGRTRRRDFWIGFAIVMAVSVLCNLIAVVGPFLGLATLWPMVAVHAKRLHDMGRSAWLLLAPAAVSVATMAVAYLARPTGIEAPGVITPALAAASRGLGLGLAAMAFCLLIEVAFLLWVGLTPGEPGGNRYGSSPARA
jgi:uncharacterized membrane protein YhaH (DUF805 family)